MMLVPQPRETCAGSCGLSSETMGAVTCVIVCLLIGISAGGGE